MFSKLFEFEMKGADDPNRRNYLAFMFPRMEGINPRTVVYQAGI